MTTVFRRPSTAASPSHAEGLMRHGFASFFRAPVVEDMDAWRADIGFVGVPFDGGTNDRPGARFGPAAIRDASTRYEPDEAWSGWIDAESGARILAGVSMADVGDIDVRTVDSRTSTSSLRPRGSSGATAACPCSSAATTRSHSRSSAPSTTRL